MHIQEHYPLQDLNTFGLPAFAEYFIRCTSIEDVQQVVKNHDLSSALILGGGSNILLTNDVKGLVIKMDIEGKEILNETAEEITIRVGAGENWHSFVMYAINNDWGGVENLSLIPGTVGAAPMQNIGAYGVEIEQVFDHLRAIDRSTGELVTFFRDDCEFGYRESIFKTSARDKYIICDVAFKLKKPPHEVNIAYGAIRDVLAERGIDKPDIRDVSDAVISIRQSKLPDPKEIGNSGSFFKNPTITASAYRDLRTEYPEIPGYPVGTSHVKVPAGWLIEQCGWKGYVRNKIGVHKNQALVLVNYGGGSGKEIEELSREIQASVKKRYGISLQAEVNII